MSNGQPSGPRHTSTTILVWKDAQRERKKVVTGEERAEVGM